MDKPALLAFLRATPFFSDLADSHLATLAEHCSTAIVPAGQRFLTMGQEAHQFSVLVSGEVRLGIVRGTGELVPVDRILPHGFLGWSALIPPHRWSYDAETVSACEFLHFDGQQVRALCEADPLFGTAMMTCLAKAIAGRLMATRHTLVENYS